MTILKINLDEIQEATVAPAGRYELQITSAEQVQSRNTGNPMIKVSLGFIEGDYLNITHFINLPTDSDDVSKAKFKGLMLKRFLALFGITYDSEGIDLDQLCMDLPGSVATVDVEQQALARREGSTNDNDVIVNRINIPRIR